MVPESPMITAGLVLLKPVASMGLSDGEATMQVLVDVPMFVAALVSAVAVFLARFADDDDDRD